MTVASLSRTSALALPTTLRTGQAAMQLPEVQDMLRRLSAFQLGIFMPHQHDEATGEVLPGLAPNGRLNWLARPRADACRRDDPGVEVEAVKQVRQLTWRKSAIACSDSLIVVKF
jgi:hypothetical protein